MDESDTGIYAREIEGIAVNDGERRSGVSTNGASGGDGIVQVGVASGRVISLSFPGSLPEEATRGHDLLDRIERYVGGKPEGFEDVPIALTVPTDHRAVLERVREVPYGETSDVATLARTAPGLDPDEDEGVVRAALEANPVPILIPDHRVLDGPSALPTGLDRRLRSVESSE